MPNLRTRQVSLALYRIRYPMRSLHGQGTQGAAGKEAGESDDYAGRGGVVGDEADVMSYLDMVYVATLPVTQRLVAHPWFEKHWLTLLFEEGEIGYDRWCD